MWRRTSRLTALAVAVVAAAAAPGDAPITLTQPVMGTLARITVHAASGDRVSQAMRAAFDRLRELDARFSDYDPQSELSRNPAHPSRDLRAILALAEDLRVRTGGAFDHRAGALTKLWRESRRHRRLPMADEIEAARLGPISYDLGGIAKGFAAEAALHVLKRAGFRRAMVAISGDLCLGDAPPGRDGWQITVSPGAAKRTLTLRNLCVSTSGDAEQFFEAGGTRYSHIIDPRSGEAVSWQIGATVIAPRGAAADALATALCVAKLDPAVLTQYGAHAIVWTPAGMIESPSKRLR